MHGVYRYPSPLLPLRIPLSRVCHLFFSLSDLIGTARGASIFSLIWITRTQRVTIRYKFHLLNAKFIQFICDLNHFPVRSTEKFLIRIYSFNREL